ncbi:uncharacterized protein TRAVEDRAFT_30882 [Trametes versicolor FP-101664 SS1]|uniref:uncharacterized protein n=1 Tax=Trametes versicolor (strain FP-101664) TaxID=717944 RepID=UPI0004623ABA|nr:uncharacterized protein TRAVEDRAFT_30882 [Trametes versicolor FP-101664 SS1]EIW54879.1 hypothetical protein TRAVEDRAFT_30882 [Trametes versicolor FP-101664 SS1]
MWHKGSCYTPYETSMQARSFVLDRRAGLEEYYNYLCRCEVCSLRGQALRDSDRRRRHIAQIRTDMVDYLDSAFGLHKIKLAIKLLREEKLLEHSSASFYIKGFDFCARAGDVENARAWAKKACETLTMSRGPNSSFARHWNNLAEHPEESDVFQSGRKKYKLTGPEF